jgi:membrane fusion protein, multidrug efflux system
MNDPVLPPSSQKGRLLYFIWKHLPRLVLLGLILLIMLLGILVSGKKERLDEARKAAQVEQKKQVNAVVLTLHPRPIEDVINLPGTIEPWTRLELLAKVSGAITEVRVSEGDAVKAGEVLALIDADDYRIALEAARAAHTLAKADYERGRTMHQTKVIPVAGLESLAARLQTAGAELEKAQVQLARCAIKAPMDGVVKRLDAKVGLFLSVGDPLAELLQIDRVKAVVGIPESDVDAVRRLDQVELTVQALADRHLVGRRHFLAPSPDAGAYLFRLELALDNPGHEVLPGMFFRARLVKQRFSQALAVPLYAIISRGEEQYVFVAEGGTVRKQPVRLGVIQQWQVQIVDGLKAGDQILIEGQREVDDGQAIKIIKTVDDPKEIRL